MLGSPFDADDAVRETMIRAWRGYSGFGGRASLKSWLYKIATSVCLDELKSRGRRARPIDEGTASSGAPPVEALTKRSDAYWIEPLPDSDTFDQAIGPEDQVALRESVRLAFVAALQMLPPKQRAALLMTEVLDFPVAEVAELLDTSLASINSALQRARSSLAKRQPEEPVKLSMPQHASADDARPLRHSFGELRRLRSHSVDAGRHPVLHAALLRLAANAGRGRSMDAWHGVRVSRLAPSANLRMWVAGTRAVPARS